ncbi:cellulose-binding protein, partial [Nonomuraea sp. MG754425]|uniref:cellulose binding domain-containing protein n=1 Tax=Nonomuraea sp. MG754425 TaxID=2570319 RepID=UPI001F2A1102
MHRRGLRGGLAAWALAVCLAASAVVTTVTAHAAAAGCQVTYTIGNQWAGGFGANIAIKNLGDPLTGWTLRWAFTAGQTISQAWNAGVTQNGGTVTASDAGWNGSLATGAGT